MATREAEIGLVPGDWKVVPLITYLERITYGFTNPMPDTEVGPWKITAKDVVDGNINYATARHTSQDAFDNLLTKKSKPRVGDVLLTKDGSIGRVAVVDRDGICINQSVALLRPNQEIRPFFLKYLLLTSHYQRVMERDSDGSTIKHIYITRVDKMQVAVPPTLEEQDVILNVVKTLDDKIELNRRMNETLEAIARAIFKSWFVDFDPVRAKASGEPPESICCRLGLTLDLLSLFPARLVDTELGEIPEGWELKTVKDVCSTVTRGVSPKYEVGTGRYIINQRVNRGAHLDWTALKELSTTLDVPSDCYAKRWDVLVNCLGEGTLGRTHLFKGKSDIYAIDQHMSICRGVTNAVGAYLYQVLTSQSGQERIESLKTGSTGMTMFNISKLREFDFLWPGNDLMEECFRIIQPAWASVANNEEQSRTLVNLRDMLLPKLLSGEIRTTGSEFEYA